MINEGLSKEIHNDLIEFISSMKERYLIDTNAVNVEAVPDAGRGAIKVSFAWTFTVPVPE